MRGTDCGWHQRMVVHPRGVFLDDELQPSVEPSLQEAGFEIW